MKQFLLLIFLLSSIVYADFQYTGGGGSGGGDASAANQLIANGYLSGISSKLRTGPLLMTSSLGVAIATDQTAIPVTGPLTDAELRASPVPVTFSGGGDASAANQVITNNYLLGISTKLILPTSLGQKLMTSSLGVTFASDQSALPVTGTFFQATQPVSGTVTANAGTNLNTSALALESGGNLASQTTAHQIIDDWDESDRAKVNPIVGQAGVQGGSGTISANTQRVVVATDQSAIQVDLRRGQTILHAFVEVNNMGDNVVVTGVALNKIKVLSYTLVASAATNVTWFSGTGFFSSQITGQMSLATNGGISSALGTPAGGWLFETAVGEDLNLSLEKGVQVGGHISYILEN